MPFMKGKEPIRRTINFLSNGKLLLKNEIKIFSVTYNTFGKLHEGARDFVFWHFPQIQYKNPDVQVISIRNITPTPYVRCYYENGQQLLIDIESKTREEIMAHMMNVVGKSSKQQREDDLKTKAKDNPAFFGVGCMRPCICMVPGQVPCPGIVPLPDHMRGKFKYNQN